MADSAEQDVMNMRWPENEALRAERMAHGWSYAQQALEIKALARRLHEKPEPAVDATACWRWEAGVQRPSPYYRRLLCLLYGKPAHDLGLVLVRRQPGAAGLVPCPDFSETPSPMNRRKFLEEASRHLVGLGALGIVSQDHPLRRAAMAIDASGFAGLRRMTEVYARELSGVPFWYIEPNIRSHLAFLHALLSMRPRQLDVRELGLAVTEASILMGWVCYFLNRRVDAHVCWSLADQLSVETGDGPLRAYALTSLASLYSGRSQGRQGGDSRMTIALLTEAARSAGPRSHPYLRAYLWSRRAEEYAASHRYSSTLRDLDRAESAVQEAREPDDGFFSDWSAARLAGYHGNCAVLLGRPDEAAAVLEGALARTPAELGPQRAGVLADLGAAYAQPELLDLNHSCSLLLESLRIANRMGVLERVQRVVRVRQRHLQQWNGEKVVTRLDDEIEAISSRLTS